MTNIEWTLTDKDLPKKPGLRSYERIECIVRMRTGETEILMWNCEHLCWDDHAGDDFRYSPKKPLAWIPTKDLPVVPREPDAETAHPTPAPFVAAE